MDATCRAEVHGCTASSTPRGWTQWPCLGPHHGIGPGAHRGYTPLEICWAWAEALRQWLVSTERQHWLAARPLVRADGRHMTLMSLDKIWEQEGQAIQSAVGSKPGQGCAAQKWGKKKLRSLVKDPEKAVARNAHLRRAGNRIRQCFEDLLTQQVLTEFENVHEESPFADDLGWAARERFRHEFETELIQKGCQYGLLREVLSQAQKP